MAAISSLTPLGVIYALHELGLADITLLTLLQVSPMFKDRLVKQGSRGGIRAVSLQRPVQAFERVPTCLSQLRERGVAVALDDFGTGYSSFSYFEELDFDTIKLDRSFIQKLSETRASPRYALAVVHAVVEITAVLDVRIVAEGIETADQREQLRSLGCTFAGVLLRATYTG